MTGARCVYRKRFGGLKYPRISVLNYALGREDGPPLEPSNSTYAVSRFVTALGCDSRKGGS